MTMSFKFAPIVPKYIDLELTNGCPADCPMCPRDKLPKIGVMTPETFDNVFNAIKSYGKTKVLSLCGIGEPLLHPKIFEYIARLKGLNIEQIGLITAGEKLTPEVFEKLKELKVNFIEVSLQAVGQHLYEKLMPGLRLEKVLANLDYISQNQSPGLYFSLSTVVHQLNKYHLQEISAYARSRNLKLNFREIHTRGGNLTNPDLLTVPPLKHNPYSCKIFELINFISWTGDVQACCHDISRSYIIGNINRQDFYEISAAKAAKLYSEQGLDYNICRQCNDAAKYSLT
jgi:radical SAM protein with 4Fe4S-binding SPASM domain